MPNGRLDVYVEGAVQIKDTTILGKGSPYCILTMGAQEFKSPPVPEGGTHPFFNTKFQFQVDRTTEQLEVRICSKKTMLDDDLLGYCTIFFKDAFYLSHMVPVTAYALTRPSGRPGGHINLSLTFKAQPRPAPPPVGFMAPQPRPPAAAGPYRQPRPVGPGHYRQPRPPPPRQQIPPQSQYAEGAENAAPYPPHAPRRMNEDSSSGSDSDGQAPGPHWPAQGPEYNYQQPPARGRGRRPAGPPPCRGGFRSRPQGPRASAPPEPNNNALQNFGGAFLQNVGGALVGSVVSSWLNSDGDGSDWGGGDDVSVDGSYGQVETASYGSAPEDYSCYENHGVVEEVEYAEVYDTSSYDGGESSYGQDAAGAPGFGQPVGYAAPPPAAGARGAPARGRGRGRGPVRGGPPGRGRAGPPVGRAGMAAGAGRAGGRGPPAMRGRAGPPPMRGRATTPPTDSF